LDSAVDGGVVNLDALGEQLLIVSVRQRKRRYQRIARTIMSGRKQKPAKADCVCVKEACPGMVVVMVTVCLLPAR
jgi:hypothetical protein